MDLLELILGNFLGFGFALMLYVLSQAYLNKKERKYELIKQKNFLRLIKVEIMDNKLIIESVRNHDFTQGEPISRIKTEDKSACWIKVIDFYHTNSILIKEINTIYEVFRAINHVLDYEPIGSFLIKEQLEKISFQRRVSIGSVIKLFDDRYDSVIHSIDNAIGDNQ
jgi:hypothetical protein